MKSGQSSTSDLPAKWRFPARRSFHKPPEIVAPWLLGKILARQINGGWLAGRIVEVEAYLGPHITATPDAAAHSFRGVTERNRVTFGAPAHAYVYFIYGMYYCVNVTCEPIGKAGCILIRALDPLLGQEQMAMQRGVPATAAAKLTGGPGKLCEALSITRARHNGLDLLNAASPLQLRDDGWRATEIEITPRIGIRHAADLPLRFAVRDHACVSRVKSGSKAV
jgi:DNA-3-methyladenine glycosylase